MWYNRLTGASSFFFFTLGKETSDDSSAGQRVKEFIEDSRTELNKEIKSLKKKEYNAWNSFIDFYSF